VHLGKRQTYALLALLFCELKLSVETTTCLLGPEHIPNIPGGRGQNSVIEEALVS